MKKTVSDEKRFIAIATVILVVISIVALFPMILLVVASFTDENELITNGYQILPKKLSLEAYTYMVKQAATIVRSYLVTIGTTVVGTGLSVLLTTSIAYPMARKTFKYRNALSFFVYFTMLFNGGLVPTYMMWTQSFHIKNTLWALIIPGLLMNGFYIIMMRSFFQANIPDALIEAARIDGGGEYRILFQVVTPLSKPIMATMALMIGLGYWNDWMNSLYYITDDKLFSIQAILNTIITNIQFLTSGQSSAASSVNVANLPSIGIRMAIAVIGILPVLCIYPFFQKYFAAGLMAGSVKG